MKKILIFLLLFASLTAGATRYYIATTGTDGAGVSGAIGTPWRTLSYACTRATTSGDTIMVGAGTFTETAQSSLAAGVSIYGAGVTSIITTAAVLNPIVSLTSATEGTNGNQSISYIMLDGNNLTATRAMYVYLRNNVSVHHVTVEDFSSIGIEFRGSSTTGEPTTYATGNTLYSSTLTNTCGRSGAIRFSGQSGISVHDNVVTGYQRALNHDPTLVSMVGAGDVNPARGGWNKGVLFYDNTLNMDRVYFATDGTTALWGFHIESWDCNGGYQFYGNTFNGGHVPIDVGGTFNVRGTYAYSWDIHHNIWQWSAQYPTQVNGSFGLVYEGGVQDLIIRNNVFINVPQGIGASIRQASRIHEDIDIFYNIFQNIGWGNDLWGWGITMGQDVADAIMRRVNIYNNVIYSGTGAGGSATGGIMLNPAGTINNINIINNVIQNITGYGCIAFWDGTGTIDSITVQNNILYNNVNTNDFYYRNGKSVTNLVNTGNIESDPLFRSTTDFHLQSTSPARDAGIDVSAITGGTDFHGASLYGAAYDIGAFEYGLNRLVTIGTVIPTINYKIVLINH